MEDGGRLSTPIARLLISMVGTAEIGRGEVLLIFFSFVILIEIFITCFVNSGLFLATDLSATP
jgi:hypothetical protein